MEVERHRIENKGFQGMKSALQDRAFSGSAARKPAMRSFSLLRHLRVRKRGFFTGERLDEEGLKLLLFFLREPEGL